MSQQDSNTTLKQRLESPEFIYGAEIVSTRGLPAPGTAVECVELARGLAADPRIAWVSMTDNPGGNPMLPPEWIARAIAGSRAEIVLHLTCKDRNRNALESAAWQYAADGFSNVLAMTGDYPNTSYNSLAKPVFDLDSVSLIQMLRDMNGGLEVPGKGGKPAKIPATNFTIGCAVSPFKRHEAELMTQYYKLLRKLACGADFVITQLGYDLRKMHEVLLFLASHKVKAPVVGNVYLLNKFVARMFNKWQIPGCVVSDALLEQVEKYSAGPDKGKAFFRELAAKQLAALKKMGFAAGYLGGASKPDTFLDIIDKAEAYGQADWREFAQEIQFCQPGEFYLFEPDSSTGLGFPGRLNEKYKKMLADRPKSKHVTLGYRMSRQVHDKFFQPGRGWFNAVRKLFARWDKKPTFLSRRARGIEKISKLIGYECRDCGDCALPDIAYLCPRSSCAKDMRNGPCGGTKNKRCEVDTNDKDCIWARAYERLHYYRESEEMLKGPAIYYNAELDGSSAWANTYLGRDHFRFNSSQEEDKAPETPKTA